MTFPLEELRHDILDLFDDAAGLSAYRVEFGTLTSMVFRSPLGDTSHRREPGINSIEASRRQIIGLAARGTCVCVLCGARARVHRCPVTGGLY